MQVYAIFNMIGMKVVLFSLAFLFMSVSTEHRRIYPRCEQITVSICRDIPYNQTHMPNQLGHLTQGDALISLQTFTPLIQFGCYSQLQKFLCTVYLPLCTSEVERILPCRHVCYEAKERCFPILQRFGFPWPNILRCEDFPPSRPCIGQEPHISGDFYTSIYKLSLLITEESRLITALQKYIDEVTQAGRDVSHELYSILQRSKEEQLEIENSDTYPQNPINAFHLLYRIHKDWTKVHDIIVSCEDCIDSDAAKDFDISYHVAGKHIGGLPTEKDLIGAAQSIVGLWDTYQFDLKLFFDGYLFGRKTKPLSAEEILYITRRADVKDDIYEAYYWLTELLRRFKNGEYKDSGIREVTVAKALAGVYNKNIMPWKALEVIEAYPGEASLSRDLSYYKMRAQGIKQDSRKSFKRRKYSKPITKFHLRYESLCRGDIKSSKAAAHLHCYWRSSAIPYRLVKEEVVNIDPRIVLFHDVIYEDEISFLQNKSIDKIERSSVLGLQGGSALDESRISQTAWLSDLEYPLLATLARRIEMITGLSTKHKPFHCESEAFQVLNYGVGGMYESHYDPLGYRLWHSVRPEDPVECRGSGDRIATWMFYLTDIEVGGATVFPLVKTRVAPEKGAAAFWYNFKRDGEQDYDTQHAGCPVLLGTKWVSNKWIREEGQMQRRPCGLHKKDIDSLHSNNLFMQWML